MSNCRYDRRTLLKNALVGLAALPASGLIREAAAQGALPHVDEKQTQAVSLGYVHDVKKVDPSKTPEFQAGQPLRELHAAHWQRGRRMAPVQYLPRQAGERQRLVQGLGGEARVTLQSIPA
jgi:hypothetical protein